MRWWEQLTDTDILRRTDLPRTAISLDDELVKHIGSDGLAWAHALAAEFAQNFVATTVPELSDSADFTPGLSVSTEANYLALLRSLVTEGSEPQPPRESLDFTDEAVARQVPLVSVLRGYQNGVEHWLRWCSPAITRYTAPEHRAAELEFAVSVCVRYVDRLSEIMINEYEREMTRRMNSGAAQRAGSVAAILAGEEVDVGEVSRVLNYPLQANHIALTLQARADGTNHVDALEKEVTTFARRVGATGLLVNPTGLTTMDAWLATDDDAVRPAKPANENIIIGVGTCTSGIAGFVQSLEEAHSALDVLGASVPGHFAKILYYDQVRLLSLVVKDPTAITRFVTATLGDLAGSDERSRELRETLLAFHTTDRSYTAVARSSHMHKNTVIQRVARASELAGRDLTRGVDTHVALLLTEAFGVAGTPSARSVNGHRGG
ncbi:regulator of polyketide synthase expression [Mycobacteroides abscessus subsp. massiliense]|nr:regulator of polyketide synthase expression [Mycobacteroides abscessus subsp. massiliense]